MKSLKSSCPNSAETSVWRQIKVYSLVVWIWHYGDDEDTGAGRKMKALHSSKSDFTKAPAPSEQMNMSHFGIISAGTRSHPALHDKAWFANNVILLHVSASPVVSALATTLPQWAVEFHCQQCQCQHLPGKS